MGNITFFFTAETDGGSEAQFVSEGCQFVTQYPGPEPLFHLDTLRRLEAVSNLSTEPLREPKNKSKTVAEKKKRERERERDIFVHLFLKAEQ